MILWSAIFPRTRHRVSRVRTHFCAPHFLPLYTENQVSVVLYLEREEGHSQLDFSGVPDELDPSVIESRYVYICVSTDVVYPTSC